MEQLVIDISSPEDAHLIKELLKKFKSVEVSSFSTELSKEEMQARIQEGIDDADNGRVRTWQEVEQDLMKTIHGGK